MTTSAQALNEVLSRVSKFPNRSERFLSAVARHLQLFEDTAEIDALRYLYAATIRLKGDIEALEVEENRHKELWSEFAPFQAILNFSQVHMDLNTAKQHFLKPENLIGLTDIHMELAGQRDSIVIPIDLKAKSEDIRKYCREIIGWGLPEEIRLQITRRLLQIASVIDHYAFFGPEHLDREVQGLVGSIYMATTPVDPEKNLKLRNVLADVWGVAKRIREIDGVTASALSLYQRSEPLIQFIKDKP